MAAALPRLPGDEDCKAVTVHLNGAVVVRAKGEEGPLTELALNGSRVEGKEAYIKTDRTFLRRAAQLDDPGSLPMNGLGGYVGNITRLSLEGSNGKDTFSIDTNIFKNVLPATSGTTSVNPMHIAQFDVNGRDGNDTIRIGGIDPANTWLVQTFLQGGDGDDEISGPSPTIRSTAAPATTSCPAFWATTSSAAAPATT